MPTTMTPWDYENGFYETSHVTRLAKLLAQYDLYKSIVGIPGAIVECGVCKGNSLVRLATFRDILESAWSRKIIAFDTFGTFPQALAESKEDQAFIVKFTAEAGQAYSTQKITDILTAKGIVNYELVPGDIIDTVPSYVQQHSELRIALLHIDVDVYHPTATILKYPWEHVVDGGVILFDDYGVCEGETRAVDEWLEYANYPLEKLPISHVPAYVRV